MAKLTQIEAALQTTDAATFQRVGDTYLRRRGYVHLNPFGLAFGTAKTTTGTPDTFVSLDDGRFVFVEYSTQQTGLATKFAEDIEKCWDEDKTGIPVSRIAEIVLCHNTKFTPEEERTLGDLCQAKGVMLTTIGLGFLAHELYGKYPGIARDFFGIDVDTGQILSLSDFVEAYGRNQFAAPLDTVFRFREEELQRVLQALEQSALVLLSGRQGVGKSRLALECARQYSEQHSDAQVWCVFNRGPDLFQDLRTHFAAPGHYLIVVDDANRITRFEYVAELLRDVVPGRVVKILATVRDYAVNRILPEAQAFGAREPIAIGPFSNEEIQSLVSDQFGIHHHAYRERIVDIAQGNPRIAVMAARVVEQNNTLASLYDVADLYDEYYRSIRRDITELNDPTLLQVVAVVALFGTVDRSNGQQMGAITDTLQLDPTIFWRFAQRLHELEVLDMYEDEVIRVSDQVLATYLLHFACFKTSALDLTTLLIAFFPQHRVRFIDAFNPVFSIFGGNPIAEVLRSAVQRAKAVFEQQNDQNALLHLLDVFGFLTPTDMLIAAQEAIVAMVPEEAPADPILFSASGNAVPTPSTLSLLAHFWHADEADRRMSLSLLVDYLERRPSEAALLVRLLDESFGIRHNSYLEEFVVQHSTVDVLAERAESSSRVYAAKLFLAYAAGQLRTQISRLESSRGLAFTMYNFHVPATPASLGLRKTLWTRVLSFYTQPSLAGDVLRLLESYIGSGLDGPSRDVVAAEASQIQEFLRTQLDPTEYTHCVLVHDYCAVLERLDIECDAELTQRFTNPVFELAELLGVDRFERAAMGWEEYNTQRDTQLDAYAATLDLEGVRRLFAGAMKIHERTEGQRREWEFRTGLSRVLHGVSVNAPDVFVTVVWEHVRNGNKLKLESYWLIDDLLQVLGADSTYELLSSEDYPDKHQWLCAYFAALPAAAVTAQRSANVVALFAVLSSSSPPLRRDLGFIEKFETHRTGTIQEIVRLLVSKGEDGSWAGYLLADLFDSHNRLLARVPELFANDVGLLKQAYFGACSSDENTDHDGKGFDTLLTMDPTFGTEWVEWIYARKRWPSRHDDSRQYAILWQRDDCTEIMADLIRALLSQADASFGIGRYLQVFFRITEGASDAIILIERQQDAFVEHMIVQRHAESDLMSAIFDVVTAFSPERRKKHLATFLAHNQDYESFTHLSLEPNGMSWSGSAVPIYQRRIDFCESLLPMLNRVSLLQHRRLVEERIQGLRNEMEREKKRDFMRE